MATIHDNVFDAALNYIKNNTDSVVVANASNTALVTKASIAASTDFGAAGNNSGAGGGRKIQCLTGSNFQSLSVTTTGAATKVRLKDASVVLISTAITSAPKSITSADQVNIGSFSVILKDPT